ncbi:MAG: diaminopimelate epimerase [Nitrospirota bacterium]
MRFTKMHGLGNDFILIDCRQLNIHNPSELSRRLCHRHFGIGADQMLLLFDSEVADFKMRIFNADGSEVEMCGNGIRCFVKYIWDRRLSDKKVLEVETLAGIIRPEKADGMVRVDMGEPIFEHEKIPVRIHPEYLLFSNPPIPTLVKESTRGFVIDYPLMIDDEEFKITCVSMGNPHVVIFVNDVADFPVQRYGPVIETHPIFPRRTNVEFVEVLSSKEIKMRVWERGAGETMACGTGASAAAVASSMKGLTGRQVLVHLSGGDLFIDWASDNHVNMTGPAAEVFNGVIEIED